MSGLRQHDVAERSEQMPPGNGRPVGLTRRLVTCEVVKQVAVVRHLVGDLAGRFADL